MRFIPVFASILLLMACSSGSDTRADEETATPVNVAAQATGPDAAFCQRAAASSVMGEFDQATMQRMAAQSYAQCMALAR